MAAALRLFGRPARAALLLCVFAAAAGAQEPARGLARNPEWFPRVYRPYVMRPLPEPDLSNPDGLLSSAAGKTLRLSLGRLETAVRENNLDILFSKNAARYAETDLLRVKGGGAPRGGAGVQIPSGLFAGAIGAGVGGAGGLGGFGGAGGITGGARQVFGFPRGSYDPTLALGFSVDRTTSPLNSIVVSGIPEVSTRSTALLARYSQAFTTGSSLSVSFNNMRQSSTQRFLLYNPAVVSQLSVSVTQQLLSGFGRKIGRRFLDVVKNSETVMKEGVRLQVSTTLARAQGAYWDLVAARESLGVAEQSLAVAEQLLEDTRIKDEFGTMSGLDVVTAESEVAARRRDLVKARATLEIREMDLKNLISRDPGQWDAVRIEPADGLPVLRDGEVPELDAALDLAMRHRPEIVQEETGLRIQEIAVRYSKDLLRPSLLVFANFNSSGLHGDRRLPDLDGNPVLYPGGLSQALRQVRGWSYPEYAVGFSFSLNIRNRAAEADYHRARREQAQSKTELERTRNGIALEVRRVLIDLAQSRARVEAAREAERLSGEVMAAEEARLGEGASVPYEVIRRQREYSAARLATVEAQAAYAKALVELKRATGTLD
jgi:outer membrane protein TolC